MLLQWRKLYPAEQAGVTIDVEWLWRRGGAQFWSAISGSLGRGARVAGEWMTRAGIAIRAAGRQVFASDGWVAAKVPASASAIWSLAILGLVLVVALFG